MKSRTLARIAAAAVVLALAAFGTFAWRSSLRGSARPAAVARSGGLELRVTARPETPRQGANELRVEIHDAGGAPVSDADVQVRYTMSMAGMADMAGAVTAEPMGDGAYRAAVDLHMSGTWRLAIEAKRRSGEVALAEGSLTTGTPGVQLEGAPAASPGAQAHAVHVDPARRQRIGIRTGAVARGPLTLAIRTVGRVTWDETGLVDVSVKTRGWVRELHANAEGMSVRRGDPLFAMYSPELYAAQAEYLSALRSRQATSEAATVLRTDALLGAARRRLALWDVSAADVEALGRRGTPLEALPVRAPASGTLMEKNVVLGGAVEPGARLFRIAPLDRVWLDAALYAPDLDAVAVGQPATITLPGLPGRAIEGKVAFIYPSIENDTRTGRARITLENPGLLLKPDMWADVVLRVDRGERVLVPAEAVIFAGRRRVVFVDLGDGRLAPRDVELGLGNGEVYEVVSGLEPGEQIVVSGNFLVASESRLRSALETW